MKNYFNKIKELRKWLRQEVTGIIQKYVSNLKARGAAIDKVVLYGSFVGNRANEHSDIDIAVISSFFNKLDIRERQEFLGLSFGDIYDPIEPMGYSVQEYENAEPGTMLFEIKKSGKIIYSNSF